MNSRRSLQAWRSLAVPKPIVPRPKRARPRDDVEPDRRSSALADFAEYRAQYVDPVGVDYRGARVMQMPPSGQGLTALVILNILSGFDHAAIEPEGPMRFHLQIEAARRAYLVRDTFIADPQFADVPTEELLSMSFADQRSPSNVPHCNDGCRRFRFRRQAPDEPLNTWCERGLHHSAQTSRRSFTPSATSDQ